MTPFTFVFPQTVFQFDIYINTHFMYSTLQLPIWTAAKRNHELCLTCWQFVDTEESQIPTIFIKINTRAYKGHKSQGKDS